MTLTQIIKGLACCTAAGLCPQCPYNYLDEQEVAPAESCSEKLLLDAMEALKEAAAQ